MRKLTADSSVLLCFLAGLSVVVSSFGMKLAIAAGQNDSRENLRIVSVAATEKQLLFTLRGSGSVQLVELMPYQNFEPKKFPVVWEGNAKTRKIKIERFQDQRDRLFSKFQLIDGVTDRVIGWPHYVTDLSDIKSRDFKISWPKSVKGLSCVRDVPDAIALGIKSANENVVLGDMIEWNNPAPKTVWMVDGYPIPIKMDYIQNVDKKFKQMTDAGINITIIFLNLFRESIEPNSPLVHPATDFKDSPWHLGMFNVANEKGIRFYRGAIEFLADRYTRPDGKYGRISGLIIGNELQSHWVWCNIGHAPAEKVAEEYVRALRIADLAARKYHRGLRIYISLDHHWTHIDLMKDPLKEAAGKELIEWINRLSQQEGIFPWHVAFHPYPGNFFDPRFWLDSTATFSFDTQRITFKNIEVLSVFLRQDEFLYQGKPRRIILSEQGFHTPAGPDGEKIQAACYAYAYYKISHIQGIDAFMYFTHVSSTDPMSAGLDLGLCKAGPGGKPIFVAGSQKYIWDIFRQADTPIWEKTFEFAKPIIGIKDWKEALPKEVVVK